jgi:hypothetical protein
MFVSTVETDVLSQKTGAYAESNPLYHRNSHGLIWPSTTF